MASSFSRSPDSILFDRYSGPARHDAGDVLLGDRFLEHAPGLGALDLSELALELGDDTVGQLAGRGSNRRDAARSQARRGPGRAAP